LCFCWLFIFSLSRLLSQQCFWWYHSPPPYMWRRIAGRAVSDVSNSHRYYVIASHSRRIENFQQITSFLDVD
jgi:hypothetical protein